MAGIKWAFWKRSKLAKWIERFLDTGDDLLLGAMAREYGQKAIPVVLHALADPRAKSATQKPEAVPLKALCEILEPHAPPEAAEILVPQIPELRGDARNAVVRLLIRIGTDRAAEGLLLALKDNDPELKASAESWISDSVCRQYHRLTPHAAAKIGDILWGTLPEKETHKFERQAQALLILQTADMSQRLAQSAFFEPAHPLFREVLAAFNHARVPAPASVLRELVPRVKEHDVALGRDEECESAYRHLLPLLARSMPSEAERLIEEARQSGRGFWRWGAVEAIAVLAGVEDALNVVMEKAYVMRKDGRPKYCPNNLSPEQRNYLIVFNVDKQVCNGGFRQYFANTAGRHANEAPGALEAVGSPKAAELMRQAIEIVGSENLKDDRLYSRLDDDEVGGRLYELDTIYYDQLPDSIMDLLKLYAARHREHFIRKP